VETNSFKHLTHLSLRFQPANDVEVKTYLATCLRCIKEEKCILQQTLKKTEEDLNRQLVCAQQALSDKINELEKLKSDSSVKICELNSQYTTEITSEKGKAHQVK
ncbi:unnamed protein product, partial [Staurois parvus]